MHRDASDRQCDPPISEAGRWRPRRNDSMIRRNQQQRGFELSYPLLVPLEQIMAIAFEEIQLVMSYDERGDRARDKAGDLDRTEEGGGEDGEIIPKLA